MSVTPIKKTTDARLSDLERRVSEIEAMREDLQTLKTVMEHATRMFKFWAPIVATAAVTSGLVGGKAGAFLASIVQHLGQ